MAPDADTAACVTDASFELDDPTDELHSEGTDLGADVPLPPGTRLQDRYVLEGVVGTGGMGIVHRAVDLGLTGSIEAGTPIAIKMVRPKWRDRPEATARLKVEFRRMVTLDHPAIVRIFDLECDRDTWFITMELLRGETLQRALQRNRSLAVGIPNASAIAEACIAGLAHAHGRGVVHGDVKPGNIFLAEDGSVRLLDFGAGAKIGADLVRVVATRAYASPQVLAGVTATPADDIFSLSCVIYEMTTGRHPFSRCASTAARNAGLLAPVPVELGDTAWQRLRSGLAWERSERPPDVRRLRGHSTPTESGVSAPPSPLVTTAGPMPVLPRVVPRWPSLLLLGVAFSLGAAAWVMPKLATPELTGATPDGARTDPGTLVVATPVAPSIQDVADAPTGAVSDDAADRGGVPVGFDSRTMQVSEGTRFAALTLRRMDGSHRRAAVTWTVKRELAIPDSDFEGPMTGTATLASGQSHRVVYVPIIDDSEKEATETFTVRLGTASTGRVRAGSDRITVSIVDND